jgi:ferredoxin
MECVEVCPDEALEPAPQTVESIQSLRDDWEYWNDLPTSNPKYKRIDDLLQPLIMTNHYLSIRNQIPTFHADNVIAGETHWIKKDYVKHLNKHF